MKEIQLSAGTIEYQDTGGDGPVLVLLHGLMMDATLWDDVIARLSASHRCVAPTLPLGAHHLPMNPGADLSLPGIARLIPLDQPAKLAQAIQDFGDELAAGPSRHETRRS